MFLLTFNKKIQTTTRLLTFRIRIIILAYAHTQTKAHQSWLNSTPSKIQMCGVCV